MVVIFSFFLVEFRISKVSDRPPGRVAGEIKTMTNQAQLSWDCDLALYYESDHIKDTDINPVEIMRVSTHLS